MNISNLPTRLCWLLFCLFLGLSLLLRSSASGLGVGYFLCGLSVICLGASSFLSPLSFKLKSEIARIGPTWLRTMLGWLASSLATAGLALLLISR
jgi:hypothetical protein